MNDFNDFFNPHLLQNNIVTMANQNAMYLWRPQNKIKRVKSGPNQVMGLLCQNGEELIEIKHKV
jgi:hypothetical protein